MADPLGKDHDGSAHHIAIRDDRASPAEDVAAHPQSSPGMRNSKGWDGKLRIGRTATFTDGGSFSDPEVSDDSNVLPGEEIDADEGAYGRCLACVPLQRTPRAGQNPSPSADAVVRLRSESTVAGALVE